jgi:ABC-type transport system involved in cytochrome bd biosynthesis fused ATPase/permease subunit
MLVAGVAFVALSRTSETVDGLLHRKDERINRIDSEASLFAGMTLIAVVLAAFVVEIAQGRDGQPYAALGAVAGVAYVAALVVLRFRR